MKIGQVSLTYRPVFGGQDTYIENLKKVFSELGHENTVFQGKSIRHKINPEGIHAVPTPPLIGRFIPNFNWYYFNFFLKFFRPLLKKSDVLVVHYAAHYPAVKFHKHVIIVSHGIEWHTPPDQWDDRLRARRALTSFSKCTIVANDTEYLRFCGVNVKPATHLFEEVAPGKWFIPNCVDVTSFKPVAPDGEIKKLNALLVPRNIYFLRGIHLAIEAFGLLVQEGNSENNLVIIGKIVDQKYYEKCLALIAQYQIGNRVIFKGHIKWTEMPAIYAAGVCTLIPTIDCEGTSLSALESMACGTPVLATSVAGLKDLPCEHALATPLAFKEGIKKILSNREALAEKQRGIVRRVYNLGNWKTAWQKVIAQASKTAYL